MQERPDLEQRSQRLRGKFRQLGDRLAAVARRRAEVEANLATTFDRRADTAPDRARALRGLADDARRQADQELARAAEYERRGEEHAP